MHLIKSKYLLLPLLFLGLLYLLDKLFLLPEVRNHFIQSDGMIYYQQRRLQIQSLKDILTTKADADNTAVIFGDSRSLPLGELTIMGSAKMQTKYKGMNVFNFSSPQALPAYYAWLSEQVFTGLNRPKYLIVGISPDSMNRNAGIMLKPVMQYGLPDDYIQKYKSIISKNDMEGYRNSKRFVLGSLGVSVKTLRDRLSGGFGRKDDQELMMKMLQLRQFHQTGQASAVDPVHLMLFYRDLAAALQPNMSHYNINTSPWKYALDMTRGAYYGWVEVALDEDLKAETQRLESIYFKNFIVSQEQLFFFRKMLARAQLSGAKVLVYWPRVNPHLRELYSKYPQVDYIWSQLDKMSKHYGAISINMNESDNLKCDSFYDASHISALCAIELQEILLDHLTQK